MERHIEDRLTLKGDDRMKRKTVQTATDRRKVVTIGALYALSVVIMFSGIFFSILSMMEGISFTVLNAQMPGVVFGLLVTYLGLKNFLSVEKLKEEVYKDSSQFCWNNFRKIGKTPSKS